MPHDTHIRFHYTLLSQPLYSQSPGATPISHCHPLLPAQIHHSIDALTINMKTVVQPIVKKVKYSQSNILLLTRVAKTYFEIILATICDNFIELLLTLGPVQCAFHSSRSTLLTVLISSDIPLLTPQLHSPSLFSSSLLQPT